MQGSLARAYAYLDWFPRDENSRLRLYRVERCQHLAAVCVLGEVLLIVGQEALLLLPTLFDELNVLLEQLVAQEESLALTCRLVSHKLALNSLPCIYGRLSVRRVFDTHARNSIPVTRGPP